MFQKLRCKLGLHDWGPEFKTLKRYTRKGVQYGFVVVHTKTCQAKDCPATSERREAL